MTPLPAALIQMRDEYLKQWPCEPPCDSFGVCDNCAEAKLIKAGFGLCAKAVLAEAAKLITALEIYAMTNETFPEYGTVARDVIAAWHSFLGAKEGEL